MMPSMNRSMSVPDTGSMWDMHTSASQPSGSSAAGTVYVVSVKLLYNAPPPPPVSLQAVKPVFGI